jgi:effector-binding domain-containing protein
VRVEVALKAVDPTPTAVVKAATTWAEFPTLWRPMLDQVWSFLRSSAADGLWTHGHNVMLYKDDVPNVEIGVLVNGEFAGEGDVVASQLPGGEVVRGLYRGDWARLGEGHDAVQRFAAEQGLELAGPRWEIYGHEDGGEPETEIYYLRG